MSDRESENQPEPGSPDPAIPLLARFTGALLGGALGDALGYPVEGGEGNARRVRHGWMTGYLPPRHPGDSQGQISDDTQLTIHVAACLVACGRLDPADLAQRLVGWLAEKQGEGAATVA